MRLLYRALGIAVLTGVMVGVSAGAFAEEVPDSGPPLDEVELRFLELINEYRVENGKPCLVPSPTMNAAAEYMSRAMGELDFFDHNEPPCGADGECSGRDPFDRIEAVGHVDWTTAGEHIAGGSPSAEGTFEQWRTSPVHNANMLEADFTSIGIARVFVPGCELEFYWTNNFSDLIDGGGDCAGEGPDDYPRPEKPRRKSKGGCQAAPGPGGVFLVALRAARRRRSRG